MHGIEAPKSLDHLIAQVGRLQHGKGHNAFAALGLHRGQPPLLQILWEGDGLTHSDIAERLHVTPPTVTKMIQRMEQAGFVERRKDSDDQRVSRVYLTPNGRDIHQKLQDLLDRFNAEICANLSEEEQTELFRLLLKVRDTLLNTSEDSVSDI